MNNIDKTATCSTCRQQLEHYAGEPGNDWKPSYWRHANGVAMHPADPDENTIRQVEQ